MNERGADNDDALAGTQAFAYHNTIAQCTAQLHVPRPGDNFTALLIDDEYTVAIRVILGLHNGGERYHRHWIGSSRSGELDRHDHAGLEAMVGVGECDLDFKN